MNIEQQRELDREQWRDLVRGLCLVHAGGYPGAVSISKRFLQSPSDEVDLMARLARHMVQEYGLAAGLQVDDNRIVLRIDKTKTPAANPETPVIERQDVELEPETAVPQTSLRGPFLRILQLVHLPTRAES